MSYNYWIWMLLWRLDRRNAIVTLSPHALDRAAYWNINPDSIKECVRTGKIIGCRCERPNKLCFSRYFGKENATCTAIVRFRMHFIEVVTVWSRKGR